MWRIYGKIQDFIAGENLVNNQIYIIDRNTQRIRRPTNPDEWWNNEVVWVNNVPTTDNYNFEITAGEMCRCWKVWIQL